MCSIHIFPSEFHNGTHLVVFTLAVCWQIRHTSLPLNSEEKKYCISHFEINNPPLLFCAFCLNTALIDIIMGQIKYMLKEHIVGH
jgi:hypothetical protein